MNYIFYVPNEHKPNIDEMHTDFFYQYIVRVQCVGQQQPPIQTTVFSMKERKSTIDALYWFFSSFFVVREKLR